MSSSKIPYVHFVASIKRSLALNRALDHKFYEMLKNIQEKDGIGRIVVEKDYLDEDRLETLKSFWTCMTNSGINVEGIQEAITDMIIKTVIYETCRLVNRYNSSWQRKGHDCHDASASFTSVPIIHLKQEKEEYFEKDKGRQLSKEKKKWMFRKEEKRML